MLGNIRHHRPIPFMIWITRITKRVRTIEIQCCGIIETYLKRITKEMTQMHSTKTTFIIIYTHKCY